MQHIKKDYFTTAVSARSIRNELDLNEKIDPLQQKDNNTTAVSAQSIRNELDLNEKDRPTTTEVTAKSGVNRNNE